MIVSASRRTDIPAFYSEWFFNRIEEGYALVRSPFNPHQLSRISLLPEDAECIVFWSKNPGPMLHKLHKLNKYRYYFQYTLNGYENDIEPGVPGLEERIKNFITLSEMIGKERIIWRYDPILINEKYTARWHMERFACLAERLGPYTDQCVISFVDIYDKIKKNMHVFGVGEIDAPAKLLIAESLLKTAGIHHIRLQTCAENVDLPGIVHGSCIDEKLVSNLLGCPVNTVKDKNQRPECRCVQSVDIGAYNTCLNGCAYCYANLGQNTVVSNFKNSSPNSPILYGDITELDKITERKMPSIQVPQTAFF